MLLDELQKDVEKLEIDFNTNITHLDPKSQSSYLFVHSPKLIKEECIDLLIHLTHSTNQYVILKSIENLSKIFLDKLPTEDFLDVVCVKLNEKYSDRFKIQILKIFQGILIRKNDYFALKKILITRKRFIETLSYLLKYKELQYDSLMVLWTLSFDEDSVEIFKECKIFDHLYHILCDRTQEKVVRAGFNVLYNSYKNDFNYDTAHTDKIQRCIRNILERCEDIELLEVLRNLDNIIENRKKEMNTVKSYLKEVFGNRLDESKCHYDGVFWDMNISVILKNKIEILKALKKYLRSHNPRDVCVASNDIHMILKYEPSVYYYVEKFKIKDELLRLSGSENSEISFYTTRALTTCIFTEWK